MFETGTFGFKVSINLISLPEKLRDRIRTISFPHFSGPISIIYRMDDNALHDLVERSGSELVN